MRVAIAVMKHNNLFEHKETTITYEESMGDPTKYLKLLEPLKLDRNNDGKCTNLVCSNVKNKGIVRSATTGIQKIQIIDLMKRNKLQ